MNSTSVTVAIAIAIAALGCGTGEDKGKGKNRPELPEKIRVTGIPDENPTELAREYEPMTKLLTKQLGIPVEYVPVTDYGAAVQALIAGKVDFAWLGGFTHVQSRNMADVVPLVMRNIDREFHSVFIANAQSGIEKVEDTKAKKFAFGSKSSTSGHLMPRHFLLTEYSIDPDRDFDGAPVFSGAHDATAKMVESGKVQAGAMNKQVWERMAREGAVDTDEVKVIWQTPPYVDYVWTARAALPEQVRKGFADAFLGLDPTNPEHKPVLDRMGAEKYVTASPSDFDAIEAVATKIGLLEK
jgi:phosphonate transport system substrate-binding protein